MKLLPVALLVCFTASAQTTSDAHQLLENALQRGITAQTRNQVEPMLRQAANIWEDRDPLNPEYAKATVLLGLLHNAPPGVGTEALSADVEPLYRKAISIYNHTPAADPGDVALALELEADILAKLDRADEGRPLKERAAGLRKKHIEDLQSIVPATVIPGVQRIGGGISAPVVLTKAEPEMNDPARFSRQQGTVVLSLVVSADGVPSQIRLVRSVGFGLDEDAVRAVQQWRFRPGRDRDGEPVPVFATIEVNFRIL